jgi:quinol monooxygenase YgiN
MMVHVIASIQVKPGKVQEFIDVFKTNVPNVLAEKGCIDYLPTIDLDAGLPPQQLAANTVTIIERWERLEDLHAHLKTPHMLAYREKVRDIVQEISLKVLQEV